MYFNVLYARKKCIHLLIVCKVLQKCTYISIFAWDEHICLASPVPSLYLSLSIQKKPSKIDSWASSSSVVMSTKRAQKSFVRWRASGMVIRCWNSQWLWTTSTSGLMPVRSICNVSSMAMYGIYFCLWGCYTTTIQWWVNSYIQKFQSLTVVDVNLDGAMSRSRNGNISEFIQ